jgi:hypothetical protein
VRFLAKYSGIASLLVAATTVIYCSYKQNFNLLGKQPLSYLGATSSQSIFRAGLIFSILPMVLFLTFIKSHYLTSRSYLTLFVTALLAETILAIIPEQINGKAQISHWVAAWVFVVCLALSVILFGKLNRATEVGRVSMIIGAAFVAALGPEVILYIIGMSAALSQIINAAIFGIWVIYVTLPADGQASAKVHKHPVGP